MDGASGERLRGQELMVRSLLYAEPKRDLYVHDRELVGDIKDEPRIREMAVELRPIAFAGAQFQRTQKRGAGVGKGVDARPRTSAFDAPPYPLGLGLFDVSLGRQELRVAH